MAFGASSAVQSNPRLQAFTAGPTAPYLVSKTLTANGDLYTGTWQGESIDAGGGNDVVYGNDGMDYLDGNSGNDSLYGGTSHDALRGRDGSDLLSGGSGDDDLQDWGTAGADTLDGGAGNDSYDVDVGDTVYESVGGGIDKVTLHVTTAATYTLAANVEFLQTGSSDNAGQLLLGNGIANGIAAGGGNDSVYGLDGDDGLFGEAGNDYLHGGQGKDWLEGGTGNDTMEGSIDDDIYIVQQSGDLVVEYADAGWDEVRTDLGAYTMTASVEKLTYWGGGSFSATGNAIWNVITGGAAGDVLRGGGGNDTLNGGGGNDALYGGADNDRIDGGAGQDSIHGEGGNELVYAGADNDSVSGGSGNDVMSGDGGNDTVSGDSGNDYLMGNAGNDHMLGGTGADTIIGGNDDDVILGGSGRDVLLGGTGVDTFRWTSLLDSTNASRDEVGDFESNDILDLHAIDADATQANDQKFNFVEGGRPFFTSAGDLWLEARSGGGWTLKGDVDGDGVEDIAIDFTGYYKPVEGDMML